MTSSPSPFHQEAASGIGQRIQAWRRQKGLNLGELARDAGLSRTTLFHLERGKIANPRATTIEQIAQALHISPSCLWQDEAAFLSQTSLKGLETEAAVDSFDAQTNPVVQELAGVHPEWFFNWTARDWAELSSVFGTGGHLNAEGVQEFARRLQQRKEVVQQVEILMETHLAESVKTIVNALFQSVQVSEAPWSAIPPRSL